MFVVVYASERPVEVFENQKKEKIETQVESSESEDSTDNSSKFYNDLFKKTADLLK
jgi:hypothetical protein